MLKAHRIDDLAAAGPFSRAKLYVLIKNGRLKARKVDGVTFVLEEDWAEMLRGAASVRSSNPIVDSPIGDVMRSFDATMSGINAAGAVVSSLGAKIVG